MASMYNVVRSILSIGDLQDGTWSVGQEDLSHRSGDEGWRGVTEVTEM